MAVRGEWLYGEGWSGLRVVERLRGRDVVEELRVEGGEKGAKVMRGEGGREGDGWVGARW